MKLRTFSVNALTIALAVVAAPALTKASPPDSVASQHSFTATYGVGVQHRYFGSLEGANGPALLLRLRDGRLLRVDATEAFARQRVSEPLFPGKATVVEGEFASDGTFHASAVKRAAFQPLAWGIDR